MAEVDGDWQDVLRRKWMADIPAALRKPEACSTAEKSRSRIPAGGQFRKGGIAFSEKMFRSIPEAVKLYKSGVQTEDIAIRLGMSGSSVKKMLQAAAAAGECERRSVAAPCVIDGFEYESQAAASRALGVSRNAIARRVKSDG